MSMCWGVVHTYSTESDKLVLSGVDGLVIGPVSPHVGSAVDQPGSVQHQGVPKQSWDEVGHPQRLPPQVPRHDYWDNKAHDQHRELVIPVEEIARVGISKKQQQKKKQNAANC